MRRPLILIALPILTSCVQSAGYPGTEMPVAQESQLGDTGAAVRTARFELLSDPRVALHHFLLDWAAADAGEWPPYAPTLEEREGWRSGLGADEQAVWTQAVEAYAGAVGRSLVFDAGLLAVRDWAAGNGPRNAISEGDQGLAAAVEAALPVYRHHWWNGHDERSRDWIASVIPMLGRIEEAVIPRLEAAYGGRWPDTPVAVDVVEYANPVGAYSTGGRITIASGDGDNRMPQALELVFHEASHLDPLELPLRTAIREAFEAAGGEAPDRLWHDVIFYTTGEITRIVLAEYGEPDYRHYGEGGVYVRGERWPPELAAFENHWRPFLHSGSAQAGERRTALEAMARQLSTDRADSSP
jgi:hypothetical protein